ncbi:MAG: hypothetical protein ACE5FL_10210, partial [Myxococcota bacterium]
MLLILVFFTAHWLLSVFFQTFFLHRYGAHRQFTMRRGWERFFYGMTFLTQGSSFLVPRAYAYLHREHHAYSDTAEDPHAPKFHKTVFSMMWHTKLRYDALCDGERLPEPGLRGETPRWDALDTLADRWTTRIAFAAL